MGENSAALRAAVFSLASKNLRGGGVQTPPPPSRARVKLAGLRSRPTVMTARSWRRANADQLNQRLEVIDWSPVFHSADPATQWEYFLSVTRPVLDELAPLKRTRLRNPTAPPVTETTKQLMAERHCGARIYKGQLKIVT